MLQHKVQTFYKTPNSTRKLCYSFNQYTSLLEPTHEILTQHSKL